MKFILSVFFYFFLISSNHHQKKFSFLQKVFPQWNQLEKIKIYKVIILKKIKNQKPNFCQGIFYRNNYLYYSSGLYGKSVLKKINLKNYKLSQIYNHNQNIFGEGITIINNFLWQLSWQAEKLFIFDIEKLKLIKTFKYNGEGWGLTHDENYLIMSDGSEFLFYRNKKKFSLIKKKKSLLSK